MYRMVRHTPLSSGHKYGDILKDGDLSATTIQRFLASGTLVRVSTPPLFELPGEWEKRSDILAKVEIITVQNLIEADAPDLAHKIKRPARIIKQWQDEALAWLNPPSQNKSG